MRGNSEIASVEFQFKKSPIVDAEVERFYEEWAEENQWEQFEKNEFRKDNQTVIIGFGRLIETNYQIGCMEPR